MAHIWFKKVHYKYKKKWVDVWLEKRIDFLTKWEIQITKYIMQIGCNLNWNFKINPLMFKCGFEFIYLLTVTLYNVPIVQ